VRWNEIAICSDADVRGKGESLPVDKIVGDELFSGSIAIRGDIEEVVTATGEKSKIGNTAKLVQSTETKGHVQQLMFRLGNFLIILSFLWVVAVLIFGLVRGQPPLEVIEYCVVLIIASIPVALPTVMTVSLALGARELSQHQTIVSRLTAIEELASMDILCSDKTGTLTKNALTVGLPLAYGTYTAYDVLGCAALASAREEGDPIDRAVVGAVPDIHSLDVYKVR
jgi:H+-transporting ATPase